MAGRRAAIGATSAALLMAAVGTSLAAVRAARYEGGVASSGLALPAGTGPRTGSGSSSDSGSSSGPGSVSGSPLDPGSAIPVGPDGSTPLPPGAPAPPAGPAAPAPAGPAAPGPASPAPSPGAAGGGSPSAGQQSTSPAPSAGSVTAPTLGPANGPTPTTIPSRPSSVACPGEGGIGAVAPSVGDLRAVRFSLPWPGVSPVVLLPQHSATRPAGASVKITESSVGGLADDGSSLTVSSPTPTDVQYTLVAGRDTAGGSIVFTPTAAARVNLERNACRERRFALYDVARGSLDGSPLRIVGVVAPMGTVTVTEDGGIAHFRSSKPGTYTVMLLTATDAGAPGPLVTAVVAVP